MDLKMSNAVLWLLLAALVTAVMMIIVFVSLKYSAHPAMSQPTDEGSPQSFDELFDQIRVHGRPTPGYVFGEGDPNGHELREKLDSTLPNLSFDRILSQYPNMNARKRAVLTKIQELGYREPNLREPLRVPVLSIEDFFDGNDVEGSIAVNLEPRLSNEFFRENLIRIRNDPDVEFVAIDTWHIDTSGQTEPDWPSAEFVYVGGNIPESKLLEWQELLRADAVLPGWEDGVIPKGLSKSQVNVSVYRFWWD
jgi:hypothetical protein